MANILMLTPDGEDVNVDDSNFDAAKKQGLEPAFEMVDKDGNNRIVRNSNRKAAEKAGLQHKAVYDAQNTDVKPLSRDVGALESAGRGFANAGTFGFADEVAGAASAPKGALKSLAGVFGKDVSKDPDVQNYQMARDQYRSDDDNAYANNKAAYFAGGALPAAAQLLAPAGAAQSIGKAALAAGSQGALQGLGGGTDLQGQADLTKGDIGGAAQATGLGAGLGAAVGAGVNKLSSAIPAAANKYKDFFGYRATGGLKSDINKIYGATPEEIGRNLLDEGAIPWFGKRGGDEIKDNIQGGLNKYADKQKAFLSDLDNSPTASSQQGVGVGSVVRKVQKEINDLAENSGTMDQAKKLNSKLKSFIKDFGQKEQVPVDMPDMTPKMSPLFEDELTQAALPEGMNYSSAGKGTSSQAPFGSKDNGKDFLKNVLQSAEDKPLDYTTVDTPLDALTRPKGSGSTLLGPAEDLPNYQIPSDKGGELSTLRNPSTALIEGKQPPKIDDFEASPFFTSAEGFTEPLPPNPVPKAKIPEPETKSQYKKWSFLDALKEKQSYDKGGKYNNPLSDAAAIENNRTFRKSIKDATDDAISKVAGPEDLAAYQGDRMKSKKLLDALNAVEQSQKRDQANKLFGITDWSLGAGGAGAALATHNPATALATAGLVGIKKLGEKYGDAFTANLLNTASKYFEKYGQTEGAKRLGQVVGPDLAREITNAVNQ